LFLNAIVERCVDPDAAYGDPGNQRTVTTYYASETELADADRTRSVVNPDGRMTSYTYEYGTYMPSANPAEPGAFTPGAGNDIRSIVVHGTVDQPDGIAFKTTREISIQDELGRQVMQAIEIFDGSSYHRISWAVQQYDEFGCVTDVYQSNGTHSESTWGCCVKDSETDAQGIERTYAYDDLQRLITQTKEGSAAGAWPAQWENRGRC
jgi:hypothetical protein